MLSIDEMIEQGKTLPEIQKELRKQVAARDEATLSKMKMEQLRKDLVAALFPYLAALDIDMTGMQPQDLMPLLLLFEKEVKKLAVQQEDSFMAAARLFADSL